MAEVASGAKSGNARLPTMGAGALVGTCCSARGVAAGVSVRAAFCAFESPEQAVRARAAIATAAALRADHGRLM